MSTNLGPAREAAALAKSDQLGRLYAYADLCYRLGFALGRGAMAGMTYAEAFTLGHDTGLGARQDTREIVRGIIDGYSAGCQARHRLVAELLGKGEPCNTTSAAIRPQPSPAPGTPPTPAAATTPATSPTPSTNPTPAACAATT